MLMQHPVMIFFIATLQLLRTTLFARNVFRQLDHIDMVVLSARGWHLFRSPSAPLPFCVPEPIPVQARCLRGRRRRSSAPNAGESPVSGKRKRMGELAFESIDIFGIFDETQHLPAGCM